jgi:hypothetical protein
MTRDSKGTMVLLKDENSSGLKKAMTERIIAQKGNKLTIL